MKSFYACLIALLISSHALAEDIAVCHSPVGKAYYAFDGIVPQNKAGWQDDAVTGGKYTLSRQGKDFDLLYVDATKRVASTRTSGGIVQLMRVGQSNFSVLVYYLNSTIEIYSFIKEKSGRETIHIMQSKGGDTPLQKSSVMVGKCEFINFEKLQ
jgi:hypothetical protein